MTRSLKIERLFAETFADTVEEMRENREFLENQKGITRDNKEWSKAAFARRVFGEQNSPESKYQRITKIVKRVGKPQNLPLEEAYALASVLGYDFSDFIKKIEERVNERLRENVSKKGSLADIA